MPLARALKGGMRGMRRQRFGAAMTRAEVGKLRRSMPSAITAGGAARVRRETRAIKALSPQNLKTLFRSALGTFPGRKTGLIAGEHRRVPSVTRKRR